MKPGGKQNKIPPVTSWWRPVENCCLLIQNARDELGTRGGHYPCPSSLRSTGSHLPRNTHLKTADPTYWEDHTKPHKLDPAAFQGKEQGYSRVQDFHTWLVAASLRELRLIPAGLCHPHLGTSRRLSLYLPPYPPAATASTRAHPESPGQMECRAAPSLPAPGSSCGAGRPSCFTYLFGTVNKRLSPQNHCG